MLIAETEYVLAPIASCNAEPDLVYVLESGDPRDVKPDSKKGDAPVDAITISQNLFPLKFPLTIIKVPNGPASVTIVVADVDTEICVGRALNFASTPEATFPKV